MFLKISQNSQKGTDFEVFFLIAGLRPATLLKKDTLTQVFSCEFCKFFKNTFFTEHVGWLRLNLFQNFLGKFEGPFC